MSGQSATYFYSGLGSLLAQLQKDGFDSSLFRQLLRKPVLQVYREGVPFMHEFFTLNAPNKLIVQSVVKSSFLKEMSYLLLATNDARTVVQMLDPLVQGALSSKSRFRWLMANKFGEVAWKILFHETVDEQLLGVYRRYLVELFHVGNANVRLLYDSHLVQHYVLDVDSLVTPASQGLSLELLSILIAEQTDNTLEIKQLLITTNYCKGLLKHLKAKKSLSFSRNNNTASDTSVTIRCIDFFCLLFPTGRISTGVPEYVINTLRLNYYIKDLLNSSKVTIRVKNYCYKFLTISLGVTTNELVIYEASALSILTRADNEEFNDNTYILSFLTIILKNTKIASSSSTLAKLAKYFAAIPGKYRQVSAEYYSSYFGFFRSFVRGNLTSSCKNFLDSSRIFELDCSYIFELADLGLKQQVFNFLNELYLCVNDKTSNPIDLAYLYSHTKNYLIELARYLNTNGSLVSIPDSVSIFSDESAITGLNDITIYANAFSTLNRYITLFKLVDLPEFQGLETTLRKHLEVGLLFQYVKSNKPRLIKTVCSVIINLKCDLVQYLKANIEEAEYFKVLLSHASSEIQETALILINLCLALDSAYSIFIEDPEITLQIYSIACDTSSPTNLQGLGLSYIHNSIVLADSMGAEQLSFLLDFLFNVAVVLLLIEPSMDKPENIRLLVLSILGLLVKQQMFQESIAESQVLVKVCQYAKAHDSPAQVTQCLRILQEYASTQPGLEHILADLDFFGIVVFRSNHLYRLSQYLEYSDASIHLYGLVNQIVWATASDLPFRTKIEAFEPFFSVSLSYLTRTVSLREKDNLFLTVIKIYLRLSEMPFPARSLIAHARVEEIVRMGNRFVDLNLPNKQEILDMYLQLLTNFLAYFSAAPANNTAVLNSIKWLKARLLLEDEGRRMSMSRVGTWSS